MGNFTILAKHLAGRHDQSSHGHRKKIIINPKSAKQIFRFALKNVAKMNKRFEELTGMKRKMPKSMRIPMLRNPKNGDIIAGGFPGSHIDVLGPELAPGVSDASRWEVVESQTRFDLNFDSNGNVTKIQMIQGAAGVSITNKKFEDRSMRNIYKVLDQLPQLGIPKDTLVTIELESDEFPPKTMETTVG